ncbi:MAG: PspA/IM30 family protein [Opitutales bacterium]|nr:PspA/IM30 family protein [Opitutales bacterium]
MKDSIRTRIGRILTGTANSIVSKIEGLAPEMILQQAIEEVDSAIDEVKVEQGRIKAQKHHVGKAMGKLNAEHDRIGEQLTVASEQGRDDLLEAAVSRQLDIEDQLPALQQQFEDLTHEEEALGKAVTGLVAKRNEMEDELFEFRRNQKEAAVAGASGEGGGAAGGGAQTRAERADRAFSRVMQNATGVRRETLRANSAEAERLLELSKLNKKARVEARLREIAVKDRGPGG